MDNLVRALERERDQGNILEPDPEAHIPLVPGLRVEDLRNGNEEAAARIRNLAAAGNLHARVLIELDGGPPALATPFEEEVA